MMRGSDSPRIFADATDFHGFYLLLSALIRLGLIVLGAGIGAVAIPIFGKQQASVAEAAEL